MSDIITLAMAENSVRASFRENVSLNPEHYSELNSEAIEQANKWAALVYHLTVDLDLSGATLEQYQEWAISELKKII